MAQAHSPRQFFPPSIQSVTRVLNWDFCLVFADKTDNICGFASPCNYQKLSWRVISDASVHGRVTAACSLNGLFQGEWHPLAVSLTFGSLQSCRLAGVCSTAKSPQFNCATAFIRANTKTRVADRETKRRTSLEINWAARTMESFAPYRGTCIPVLTWSCGTGHSKWEQRFG
jgi:hypothetical protein